MRTKPGRLGPGVLLALLVIGCGGPAPSRTPAETALPVASATRARDPLAGTSWRLSLLRGEPLLAGTRITLAFAGGFMRGTAGCNQYDRLVIGDDVAGAQYRASEDGSLHVPGMMITQVGCLAPAGVMEQEDAYLGALRAVVAFRLVANRLELQDATGQTVLVFER